MKFLLAERIISNQRTAKALQAATSMATHLIIKNKTGGEERSVSSEEKRSLEKSIGDSGLACRGKDDQIRPHPALTAEIASIDSNHGAQDVESAAPDIDRTEIPRAVKVPRSQRRDSSDDSLFSQRSKSQYTIQGPPNGSLLSLSHWQPWQRQLAVQSCIVRKSTSTGVVSC